MWAALPAPMVPADALSGLSLSQPMSSCMSFAGRLLLPMIQSGPIESTETGSKSPKRSNGSGTGPAPTFDVHWPMPIV
jgi:hypothetical protein